MFTQKKNLISFLIAGLLICTIASFGIAKTLSTEEILEKAKVFSGTKINCAITGAEIRFVKEAISEFEKKTGIDVEIMAIPDAQVYEKLMISFMTRTAPYDAIDFMHRQKGGVGAFALNLTELNKKYEFDPKDVLPSHRAGMYYPTDAGSGVTEKSIIRALPADSDLHFFYWRKDYFEKVGLDPNRSPVDLDELMQYAEKLNKKDLNNDGRLEYGFGPRMSRWGAHIAFSTVMNAFGVDWFYEDWRPAINSPKGVKALKWWLSTRKYSVPNYRDLSWPTLFEAFGRGDFAMMWNFQHAFPELAVSGEGKPAGQREYLYGISLPPRGPAGIPHNATSGTNIYAVTRNSPNPEAAYLFIRYLTSPRIHKKFCIVSEGDYAVGYRYALYDPDFQDKYMYPGAWKLNQKVSELTQEIVPAQPFSVPEAKALHEELDLRLSQAYTDQLTAEEALNETAKNWIKIMAQGSYYHPGVLPYKPAYRKPAPGSIYLE